VGLIACEKGVAIAGGVYWGLFVAASFLTQQFAEAFGSPEFMFYSYGAISAVGVVVFICFVKETQGLAKEDIE
jgi:hypothetical protein